MLAALLHTTLPLDPSTRRVKPSFKAKAGVKVLNISLKLECARSVTFLD